MTSIGRYTPEMISQYMAKGYWRRELTVDFWEANAHHCPDRLAVLDANQRLTWGEAARRIDKLSAGLIGLGFKKDDVLLVQAGNSVWLMLFRLACEKIGLIPVFLHYGFRRREIEHIVALTRPVGAAIATRRTKFDLLGLYRDVGATEGWLDKILLVDGGGGAGLLSVPDLTENGGRLEPEDLEGRRFEIGELTSIVTSSGTTGAPKCIEYSVWPRLHSGRVYIQRLEMTADDRVADFVPLYTGPADLSYHTAPQIGSAQLLLESFSPEAACRLIKAEKATGVTLVPTMLHRILGFSGFDPADFKSLRFVTCGGGVLPFEIGRRVEERFGAKIIQAYGLMDCGAVTSHALSDSQEARLRAQGRPLDGTEVRILDPRGKPLPIGQAGEVCARGPHSNGGYMGPAAVSEVGWGADGFFRTGDLGRIDEDGYIILEGRSKDIIIRGGQNISAKEIEDVLAHHPSIKEAVAVKMPDPDLGERVCAFAVPVPGATLTLEAVVEFMKGRGIASFKIPERLELIDEMPLTPGGNKVDKKRLEKMVS